MNEIYIPKKRFILDESALSPEKGLALTEIMYNGFSNVDVSAYDLLNSHLESLSGLRLFISKNDTIFLQESLCENNEFVRCLKEQRYALQRAMAEKRNKLRINPVYEPFLDMLSSYVMALEKFNVRMQNKGFSISGLNPVERKIYEVTLQKARDLHKDHLDLEGIETHGDRLETDRKIIATAVTIAFRNPVTVISRDKCLIGREEHGIVGSLFEVVESLGFNRKSYMGLNVSPTYPIYSYDPRNSNNGFYDAEEEKEVFRKR